MNTFKLSRTTASCCAFSWRAVSGSKAIEWNVIIYVFYSFRQNICASVPCMILKYLVSFPDFQEYWGRVNIEKLTDLKTRYRLCEASGIEFCIAPFLLRSRTCLPRRQGGAEVRNDMRSRCFLSVESVRLCEVYHEKATRAK